MIVLLLHLLKEVAYHPLEPFGARPLPASRAVAIEPERQLGLVGPLTLACQLSPSLPHLADSATGRSRERIVEISHVPEDDKYCNIYPWIDCMYTPRTSKLTSSFS